jgi:hypothetical protein
MSSQSSNFKQLIKKTIYTTKIIPLTTPHYVGMEYYQQKSCWNLNRNACSCDVEFVEYVRDFNIQEKTIFHFGTGSHHIIGLENQKQERANNILGITASLPEHSAYVKAVIKNPALAKSYKVFFADIYTLTENNLPGLDIVNLFHLCEFYMAENAHLVHQNDESLLQLFLDRLNPDGKILFYTNSFAWKKAFVIVKKFEEANKIVKINKYKNIEIYAKNI